MKRVFLFLIAVWLIQIVVARTGRFKRLKADPLSKTRCDLVCHEADKNNRTACRSECKIRESKPGTCPSADTPQWAQACVQACDVDSQCDGTQRCCHHGCGSTCSEPLDLLTLPGLPALPTIAEVREKRRSVLVRWSDGVGDAARAVPGRVLYILEEQHHVGPQYEETKLGDWNLVLRTNRTKAALRDLLQPGRWYRFRAAAVSVEGTRGFSAPSAPFTPRRGPRAPPPPRRLKVRAEPMSNGTVAVRLEWHEPKSDLPVVRFKVFWSRRVRGLSGELDSVLVNHQTVPRDQTHYIITDLQPNSMYFLQVQTISQFGTGKLRSEKAAIFYNTTGAHDNRPEHLQKRQKRIKGLKLQKVIWFNNKIKARISWEAVQKNEDQPRRYYIHWKTISCENDSEYNDKNLSATTEQTSFEIYELDYHCTYKVNVNKSSSKTKPADSEIVVAVPGCESFQKRMNGTKLNCQT